MSENIDWFESPEALLAKGAPQGVVSVSPGYAGPYPMVKDVLGPGGTSGPRQDIELVAARVFKVEVGADAYASVVLCRIGARADGTEGPLWAIYCGDKQVKGEYRSDGKTLAAQLRKEGKVSTKVANALEASDWVGKVAEMSQCGFFKLKARTGNYCSHTQAVLASLQVSDMTDMAADLVGWKEGKEPSTTVAEKPMTEEEIAFYDAAFVQHVLLAGERGAGKTYLARQAADRFDAVYLELQMHPSMEAWELRAHDRSWNGKVYTVLGKLAEAVYWIQQGKKVVLCMDEFLNMNPMYATTINSPLSLTENDTYLIETGRIIDMGDGIGRIETVEVPADMFWVVATSNIGARYGLDKIAPSVRARFQIVLMNTNPERTKIILEKNLAKYDMPLELADNFKSFIEACNQAVAENTLDEEATTRLACNVIRACHLRAKRDRKTYSTMRHWVPEVKKQLMREIAQVVNFELGPLDTDQQARYTALVNSCFKAK